MKFWTILFLLSYIWTINASVNNEEETEELKIVYSPQFLRADELPTESPPTAITDITTLDVGKTSLNTDINDTKSKRQLTSTSLEESTFTPEVTTLDVMKINTYDNLSSNFNVDQPKSSRNLKMFEDFNTNNINNETTEHTKKQSTKTNVINDFKHVNNVTEFVKTDSELISNSMQMFDNSITNETKSSNISLVYSKPYRPGENLGNVEKLIVIYPERNNNFNISSEISYETTSINEDDKAGGRIGNDQVTYEANKTNIDLTSTKKNDTIRERVKQIRHDLYKRRPMTHYLLKAKPNDKLINSKDELTTSIKDSIYGITDTSITIKPFNILKKIKTDNIDIVFNDSITETVNKMRRRNGLLSVNYPDNVDQNDKNTETQMEDLRNHNVNLNNEQTNDKNNLMNKTIGEIDQKHLNNTSIKGENLYVSETQFHSSIIYDRKTNDRNTEKIQLEQPFTNVHVNNSKTDLNLMNKEILKENVLKIGEQPMKTSLYSTSEKPFRPSPEYNPKDIHIYDMNFHPLKMLTEVENAQLKSVQQNTHERDISTTIKPTISPSIMENMVLMLKQLKRLSSRQYKRIKDQATSNNTNFSSDNLEHINKYESKKIRPSLKMNRISEQSTIVSPVTQRLSERKDERTTSTTKNPLIIYRNNLRKMLRQRGSLKTSDPQSTIPMIHNTEDHLKQVVKLSNNNTNLAMENYNINNTMQALPKLEHILKTNILMDLEKIRLIMLSKNQEFQMQKVQPKNMSTMINNLGINPQNFNRANDNQQLLPMSMQHKGSVNTTSRTRSGNKRLNYLRNRTNKMPALEDTTVVSVTKPEETNNSQKNKEMRLSIRQRQRYQERKTDRMESVKNDNSTTRRYNYRTRPTTRRNKLIDHESLRQVTTTKPEINLNNSTKNETEVIIKTTENSIKRLLEGRRRNMYRSRKMNERLGNNEEHQTERSDSTENLKKEMIQELKFINKDYDNILSTTIDYKNFDTITNKNSASKFNNKEFELHGSSSESNNTVINPLDVNNKSLISSIDTHPNNTENSEKSDLITLESRQNEETYTSRFESPIGFQTGFVPMIFDLGTIIGPVPRALRVPDKSGKAGPIQSSKLPESEDQVQQINTVSPNLLTNYGNIGRIVSQSTAENEKSTDKSNNDESRTDEADIDHSKNTADLKTENSNTFHYDAALEQYNVALKTYNSYLEQFIQNKKQT